MYKPVDKSFYSKPTLQIAKNLLGKTLVHKTEKALLAATIVETEAYLPDDAACHASRGRTKRNSVMFDNPGTLYVYFTYGMYYCMNIVSEEKDIPAAILLRAAEPVQGIDIMYTNRQNRSNSKKPIKKDIEISNGPAKLCMAFGIDTCFNGITLINNQRIFISNDSPEKIKPSQIQITSRIGISQGIELPYRFFIKNNRYVSKGKPSGSF